MSTNLPDVAELRKQFTSADLSESACDASPSRQFARWVNEAQEGQLPDPTAMSLSTVAAGMRPSSRMVHMKAHDDRGIVFFTNYDSRKGRELQANPFAALLFHWPLFERMVRIEGRVLRVSDEESDASFASRPMDYRIGAWASPQSQVIDGIGIVVANAAKYGAQFMLRPPRPPHWGGYRLVPDQWEFWQGRKTKLQDRVRYALQGAHWVRERLAP